MTEDLRVVIRFKEVPVDENTKEALEKRCQQLAETFPETSRFEVSLTPAADDVRAQSHVSGKHVNAAAHAEAAEARVAGERALEKLERELRRHHDKQIYGHRREAQKNAAKRT